MPLRAVQKLVDCKICSAYSGEIDCAEIDSIRYAESSFWSNSHSGYLAFRAHSCSRLLLTFRDPPPHRRAPGKETNVCQKFGED